MRWLLALWPTVIFAQYRLDVPLTDRAAVEALGGRVAGGEFGPAGWTTTARDDRIVIPLPAGLPAREGRLHVRVANLEISESAPMFRSWMLVSLNPDDGVFRPTPAGTASVQAVYIDVTDAPDGGRQPRGYFNLFDPGCDDWRRCTGEKGAPRRWLGDGVGPFVIDQAWDGPVNRLHFERPGGAQDRLLDLSATAPDGRIEAPRFYLLVNACGGSRARSCGDWDGPIKGGPLGVRYESVVVELPRARPPDAAAPDAAIADAGAPDAVIADASAPHAATPDAAPPGPDATGPPRADAGPEDGSADVAAVGLPGDASPDARSATDGALATAQADQSAGCASAAGTGSGWWVLLAVAQRRRRSQARRPRGRSLP